MKRTILLFIIVIICLNLPSVVGQEMIIKEQLYTANLEAYTGTWEYNNGSDVFRIFLKKVNEDIPVSIGECLIGEYYYQKNGVLLDSYVESQIPIIYNNITRSKVVIYATNGKYNVNYVDPLKLRVNFNDKRLNKFTGSASIEFISPTQIRWVLKDDEGDYYEDPIMGFSVPTNVIMTKK